MKAQILLLLLLIGLFWLCAVFIAAPGLSLVAVASRVAEHRLQGTGASAAVVHRLSCSVACGIFPYQRSNPGPLHWQVGSYPPRHLGSP